MAVKYGMVKNPKIFNMAKKIIRRFDKELGHIDLDAIQLAWRFSEKSGYHARTKLITGENRIFTDKKISITFWRKSWKEHNKAWKHLLVYHELRHIYPPKKEGGEFRLIRHNVEDFLDIIQKFGPRWEKAEEFLKSLEGTK